MKNFFSPTEILADSLSPFPTEYDSTIETEMNFLRKSSLETRSDPEYINVMSHVSQMLPAGLSSFFSSPSWLWNLIPFRWIKNIIVDIYVSTQIPVTVKHIPSQPEILQNAHIQKEINRLVEAGESREEVMKRAAKMLDKLAARQTSWVIRVFYVILCFVFRTMFRIVHIDMNGIDSFIHRLRENDEDVGIVFLPTHKSHIDYLVLSYIAAIYGFPVPMIVSGDNLDFPVVGSLFRYSGAFFMRRSLGDDTLYRHILEGYFEEVLKSGSTLEFFIEGGRSRDGSILPPKYGLLNVVLDAVKSNRLKDALLVPIAIDYEHCPDINSYIKYMMGGKKKKESLTGLLKSSYSLLSTDCGDAFVTFGTPMSLQELLEKMEKEDASLGMREEVKYVGAHICQGIRNNSIATTSSLVATALLDFPADQWIPEAEICVHIDQIRGYLRTVGAFEGYHCYSPSILHYFCKSLFKETVEIKDKNYFIKSGQKEQITLLYYRNSLLHHFLADATVLYVFKALEHTSSKKQIPLVDFVPTVDLLCHIVNAYIPFLNVNTVSAIDSLVQKGIFVLKDDVLSVNEAFVPYTHFCIHLIAPLVDCIWVVSDVIKHLLPSSSQQEVEFNAFISKVMDIIYTKQNENTITLSFIANMQLVRNTIEGFALAGVLTKRKEKNSYIFSLSESYQDSEKIANLETSMKNLRLNCNDFDVKTESDALYTEVELTEDVIGLMVDVKEQKKHN